MGRLKYFYIRVKSISQPDKTYYGKIVEAKTEKAAVFYALNANPDDARSKDFRAERVVKVSEKVAKRFNHMSEVRKQIEYDKWVADGGPAKLKARLAELGMTNAILESQLGEKFYE